MGTVLDADRATNARQPTDATNARQPTDATNARQPTDAGGARRAAFPVADRADAVRFLTQTSFGASPATIDELMSIGDFAAWIDAQMVLPQSLTEPYVRAVSNGSLRTVRHHIWWDNLMNRPDQLRQRIAFALSEVFVVSDIDYLLGNAQYAMCHYYDMLGAHAFGNYRQLLERVTLHAVMGVYLSMARNERADPARNIRPDENYAREILQLFSIGLYELNPDGTRRTVGGEPVPTYDQSTIEQFAKVFTGWNYADTMQWYSNRSYDFTLAMTAWPEYHDDTEKLLLADTVLPAGQSPEQDLSDALDNIFTHPNVGPFVSTQLIQRLVTSNPTPAYVERVAAIFDDDQSGTRGDLGAVVAAILLDPEARSGHVTLPETFGKIKEPVLRLSQLWRAFDAQPGPESGGRFTTRASSLDYCENLFGQCVLKSPSVFNFFRPDHPLGGGTDLVAPEMQILTEINVASTDNMFFSQIYGHNSFYETLATQTRIQISAEMAIAHDIDALLDHLDVLLLAGSMPASFRSAIADRLLVHDVGTDEGRADRVLDAIYCIVGSPFHYVQK